MAISFALPTFSQDQRTVDPEARQQIEALFMKFGKAFNKHDPSAIAALYTENAMRSEPGGRMSVWVSKPLRKAMQPCCHRCLVNSPARLLRSIRSAMTCASSRKIVRERNGRVTRHGSAIVTPILGRSAWNTSIRRSRLKSTTRLLL